MGYRPKVRVSKQVYYVCGSSEYVPDEYILKKLREKKSFSEKHEPTFRAIEDMDLNFKNTLK